MKLVKIEKYLLRQAFASYNYTDYLGRQILPDEVLYRKKEAFSDGVSSEKQNWLDKIKAIANASIDDATFEMIKKTTIHSPPRTKEEVYYRMIFNARNIGPSLPNSVSREGSEKWPN